MQVTQAIVTALFIQTVAGDTRSVVYQSLPYTNVIFSNYLLFESRAWTKGQCSLLCLNREGCITFTFTENSSSSGTCRGHSALHQSSDPQTATPNTQYYGMECLGKNAAASYLQILSIIITLRLQENLCIRTRISLILQVSRI